jgi:hypothetical protein
MFSAVRHLDPTMAREPFKDNLKAHDVPSPPPRQFHHRPYRTLPHHQRRAFKAKDRLVTRNLPSSVGE